MRLTQVNNVMKTGLKYLTPLIIGGAIALGTAGPALADDDDHYRHDHGRYYDDPYRYGHRRAHKYKKHHKYGRKHKVVHVYHHYPRYEPEHVRVEHHYHERPVRKRVVVERPQYVEPAPVQNHAGYYGPSGSSLIGAAVGGLLGSQVGKGSGKLAATAAGTLAGFVIGGQH